MFIFQNNSKQYIYHYTTADTAINFILKNGNLRLSPYTNTNDPKETKNWFFSAGTNENRPLDKYSSEYLSKIMNPTLKECTRVLCFSKDSPLTGNHIEDMPQRGFCKPRMWAQYAGNHTGLCLIFDFEVFTKIFHEKFSEYSYKYDNVNYQDRLLPEVQLDQAFMVNIDHLEKVGNKDYAYDHLL